MIPVDIRSAIIDEIRKDTVGPKRGPEEMVSESPTLVYLSGILFPRNHPVDADDEEQSELFVKGEEDDEPASRYNTYAGQKPSSFGLTCSMSNSEEAVKVNLEYGVYSRINNQYWRKPYAESFTLRLDEEEPQPLEANEQFLLKHTVRRRGDNYILSVFVVNSIVKKGARMRSIGDCIFQPKITLQSTEPEKKIFIGIPSSPTHSDDDSELLEMLFRDQKNFAMGHGCSAQWDSAAGESGAAATIRTEFVPHQRIPTIQTRKVDDMDGLDMKVLYSTPDQSEYRSLLEPIAAEYEEWIHNTLEAGLDRIPSQHRSAAERQIVECQNALRRIREGIDTVSSDRIAGKAFAFANRAMRLQRARSSWAGSNVEAGKVEGYEPPEDKGRWWLFQLAFILLNITSIANPKSKERGVADLLWFPTGSGKTEAYMGLIAFTIFHRRLRVNDPRQDYLRYGTSVIMRYTLRLLTIQQFHRLATLMCSCEYIRRSDEKTWGGEPFLVGLWIGSNTTPNSLDGEFGAIKAIEEARNGNPPQKHNPIQLTSCPWCGQPIGPYNYCVEGDIRQCRVYCQRKSCDFAKRPDRESGIPVLVVDEDIYRRCPSLIIGTVDKFAQMAWVPQTGSIFGRADSLCKKHGFVLPRLDGCSHGPPESLFFADRGRPNLEPPELIIQDELHLIAGPLGTLVGMYETAIDILCSNNGSPPKVIASTATTRRAQQHIKSLFNRNASVFPPPGFTFGDSFFSERAPDSDPGKTFVGVCTTTKSSVHTLGRLSAAMLQKVRTLKDACSSKDLDPFYTLVSYFNTIRELGVADRLYDSSVARLMRLIHADYEEPDGAGRRWEGEPLIRTDLTSRKSSNEIPDILKRLGNGFESGNAYDVLLCTNMLSVGVDIARLGTMIINGQPKNHSEYIQASGRIGRQSPGLVVVNYNYLKPRDLSHYESFQYYHSTLHKNVEMASLTPFSARSRDRALFGVMVALARLLDPSLADNPKAGRFKPGKRHADLIRGLLLQIEARVQDVDPSEADGTRADFERLVEEWKTYARDENDLRYKKNIYYMARRTNSAYLLGSVESKREGKITIPNSLRDAEPSIGIKYLDRGWGMR